MIATETEYREISGYPGYRVGSDGTVWSRKNRGHHGHFTLTWRQLKPRIGTHNYPYVNLSREGVCKSFCVHRLILEAFVGPRPEGMECCHGPRGPHDASLGNLRWDTKKENQEDKVGAGTLVQGERHHSSKLSAQAVSEIRDRYQRGGIRQRDLATEFGVNQSVISEIVNAKTWKERQ